MLENNFVIKSEKFEKLERVLITLHGYGASGEDFAQIGEGFLSKKLSNTVFLFPDAPRSCPIGSGKQWFDLDKMTYDELRMGLDESGPVLYEYIKSVLEEYNCTNINLAGFSQGAIMAFEMLYYPGITKILAYSGIFVPPKEKTILSNASVLIVHGEDDDVVPYKNAPWGYQNLKKLGVNVELRNFNDIGHSVSIEGWNCGINFLNK
ncbi:MAG: prolyl oligopeptidase family serine peptidase [Holosporales bacterium]|jgi:phospholipase/carboxylesterase|nr:prolyl oligopeptidase family serine peptidase [Holosporales bacterium]